MDGAPVPARRMPITRQISVIGEKLGRRLSLSRTPTAEDAIAGAASSSSVLLQDTDKDSATDHTTTSQARSPSRSVSRGRDAFTSSGRGGAGNIRRSLDPASPARDPHDPDYLSPVRGREAAVREPADNLTSVGRGGLGNIRSPSRDPGVGSEKGVAEYERAVIQASEEAARTGVYSSGRGGLGNMHAGPRTPTTPSDDKHSFEKARSLSRSRSRPPVRTTGRGGAGNLAAGSKTEAELVEIQDITEAEKARKAHAYVVHSTGRGGAANITALPAPRSPSPPPPHTGAEPLSTGRGGAYNISCDGSRARGDSRDGRSRSRSAQREHKLNELGELWDHGTYPGREGGPALADELPQTAKDFIG